MVLIDSEEQRVIFIGEIRKIRRRRKKVYYQEFGKVLVWLWELLDHSCGKRLVASLRWLMLCASLVRLEQFAIVLHISSGQDLNSLTMNGGENFHSETYPAAVANNILNGQMVIDKVAHLGKLPGKVLKRAY